MRSTLWPITFKGLGFKAWTDSSATWPHNIVVRRLRLHAAASVSISRILGFHACNTAATEPALNRRVLLSHRILHERERALFIGWKTYCTY
jgi:hypothetical protein